MVTLSEKVSSSVKQYGIHVRPQASAGLWLICLLPIAIIISALRHPQEISLIYKYAALLSFGFLQSSIIFIIVCRKSKEIYKTKGLLIPGAITSTSFYLVFNTGFLFSFCSGLISSIGYLKLLIFILKKCPFSFTIGEASIVTQSVILLIYTSFLNIIKCSNQTNFTTMQTATLIVQIGLLTVGIICLLTYKYKSFRKPVPFYLMSLFSVIFFLLIPLHLILNFSPVLWILNLLLDDIQTIKLVGFWISCIVVGSFFTRNKLLGAQKATTIQRKIFHLLAVIIYFPGLLYDCSLLFTGSAVSLGILIFLDILRILNIPPLGQILQEAFMVFGDEKDAGVMALTAIYLPVACSIPIWIHPAPCDITDSAGFGLMPLLSGLLTIGIGDSAASAFGSKFGRYHWSNSKKTMEGTLACILSQGLVVYALLYYGFITGENALIRSGIGIIVTSLIEAKTSQIDNIVLPLIMYTFLI